MSKKRMDEWEVKAERMSDEALLEAMTNAKVFLFARGLLEHRPGWSSDGNVPEPWQQYVAYRRETLRRMSRK